MLTRKWLLLLSAVGLLAVPTKAVPVSAEIVLLSDVSGSVDDVDFDFLRGGYVSAFQNASVINAIETFGPIAVTLVYWSDNQFQVVPWTLVSDGPSANAFAAAIDGAVRPESGGTRLAAAMDFGAGLFAGNGFEGDRLVMDISGDGADSDAGSFEPNPANVKAARDNALNVAGVTTINALWVDDRDFFGDDPADAINALDYGQNNVIGGLGAFQSIVDDFPVFGQAIIQKIEREVKPPVVPDGGSTALLVAGSLAALGLLKRQFGK